MCSPGGAYAALTVAGAVYSYGQQARAYQEALKARQENKEAAEEELKLTYEQLNLREAQEQQALVNQERLRTRRSQELTEQTTEVKFYNQLEADQALSAIKARGGGEVRGLGIGIERDLARANFGSAENLRREKEMLGFQKSVDKQNYKYLTEQLGIARQGAKATYYNRLRSFQMPGKPDPVTSLFTAATGFTEGMGMDAKAGKSWFDFDTKSNTRATKSRSRNTGYRPTTPKWKGVY
jgi:hypothetical protein